LDINKARAERLQLDLKLKLKNFLKTSADIQRWVQAKVNMRQR
jgi:hypothetical protein